MRGEVRAESWGENCRRADIPELELARLECGSLFSLSFKGLPLLRGMASRQNDRVGGRVAIAKAAASRRTPRSCKSIAKCRRADNIVFGIGRSVHERGWSAGACSLFCDVGRCVQAIDCEAGLRSEKRRRAAALQKCRRADILDLERGV